MQRGEPILHQCNFFTTSTVRSPSMNNNLRIYVEIGIIKNTCRNCQELIIAVMKSCCWSQSPHNAYCWVSRFNVKTAHFGTRMLKGRPPGEGGIPQRTEIWLFQGVKGGKKIPWSSSGEIPPPHSSPLPGGFTPQILHCSVKHSKKNTLSRLRVCLVLWGYKKRATKWHFL